MSTWMSWEIATAEMKDNLTQKTWWMEAELDF